MAGLFLAVLSGCTVEPHAPKADGHIVGNGGDHLETYFAQGQNLSVRILERLSTEDDVTVFAGITAVATRDNLETLKRLTGPLIQELRVGYRGLREKLPEGCPAYKCGCTLPQFPHEIFVSYESCRSVSSQRQAAMNLHHEAVHLVLGADEAKARDLTTLAFDLWARWGHADAPHWVSLPIPERAKSDARRFPPLFSDEELVLASEGEISYYHPGFDRWRHVPTKGTAVAAFNFDGDEVPSNRSHWIKNHVVSYGQCYHRNKGGVGVTYSAETNQWSGMTKTDAPPSRYKPVEVVTDRGLFVWGGDRCGDCPPEEYRAQPEVVRQGGIFFPTTGWDPVAVTPSAPAVSRDTRGVWTGTEVVLWGHMALEKGAAYDPKARTWRALAEKNQPSPRINHTMAWTGRYVLVYGGCTPDPTDVSSKCINNTYLRNGALYDPVNDTWERFDSPEGPNPSTALWDLPLASYWTKRFFALWDGGIHLFDLRARRWSEFVPGAAIKLVLPEMRWTGAEYLLVDRDRSDAAIYYP